MAWWYVLTVDPPEGRPNYESIRGKDLAPGVLIDTYETPVANDIVNADGDAVSIGTVETTDATGRRVENPTAGALYMAPGPGGVEPAEIPLVLSEGSYYVPRRVNWADGTNVDFSATYGPPQQVAVEGGYAWVDWRGRVVRVTDPQGRERDLEEYRRLLAGWQRPAVEPTPAWLSTVALLLVVVAVAALGGWLLLRYSPRKESPP